MYLNWPQMFIYSEGKYFCCIFELASDVYFNIMKVNIFLCLCKFSGDI